MYSDIHSARSDPVVIANSKAETVSKQNLYFESDLVSSSRYQYSSQRWKNMLLPEIDLKYQEIMREREGVTRRMDL